MRNLFWLWLIAAMPVVASAQQIPGDRHLLHPSFIRLNIPGLLDVFDGNLSAGLEYGTSRRGALTADLGLIFYSVYINNASGSLGFHFKPNYRYYFTDRRRGFLDAGFFVKRVGYHVTDWLDRGVVNGVAGYQEYRRFVYQKNAVGIQVMSGYKAPLDKRGTIWLEFYGGLSARVKWQNVKGMPDASFRRGDVIFDNNPTEKSFWPGLPGGLRLVIGVD